MGKWRFLLAIMCPWLAAWLVALLWMLYEPSNDNQADLRVAMLKELSAIQGYIMDFDTILYSANVDSQIIILDDNTDSDVVLLGEISNRLANSSNNINEHMLAHRESLEELWQKSDFPRRSLDIRLNVQYSQAMHYIDEYIAYLSEIIHTISNSDDNTDQPSATDSMAEIMVEMNKTSMRYHQTLGQISSRILLLENEHYGQFFTWQANHSPYERLIYIILSNLFFLAVLLYFSLRINYYSKNFNKLSSDIVIQKEQNQQISPLQNKVEKLERDKQLLSQQLALTKLYQENMANNIRLGMIIISSQQELLSFNHAAATLLHLDNSDLNKEIMLQAWWRQLDRSILLQEILKKAQKGEKATKLETLILAFPGEEKRALDFVISPFINEAGKLQGNLLLIDDVTLAQNMRSRLLESERLATVGRLAAQVAHEIRNPLSSISLNSDLLGDEIGTDGDPEEARSLLSSIQKEVGRLSEITERYLDLARPQKEKIQSMDLNKLVQETLSFCARELQNNRIELTLNLCSKPLMVTADAAQLRQALLNILRNSWEAMPHGGKITISSKKEGKNTLLLISDSGPGVEPKLRHTIFDPFYTTKDQGTGLGLSITSQILKDNNASISYVELPGFGATFEIAF